MKRGKPNWHWLTIPTLIALVAFVVAFLRFFPAPSAPVPGLQTPPHTPGEHISDFKPVFVGVELCRASTETPRPMQIRVVRVDLREPSVDLLVTPSNGDEPMDCGARMPSEFLTEFKCQVAINGSAFAPPAARKGDPQDVKGLSLSRGNLYSRPNQQYDVLLISRDGRAWIDRPPIDTTKAYQGLSGFRALLIDGRNLGDDDEPHPRSVVGISADGRYLILMTIDGRQPGYSEGATTREAADWIRKFGAYHALNLDGGGSTALVIEGPDGRPVVLNRPSGKYERRVANHIGVFAKPLPPPANN